MAQLATGPPKFRHPEWVVSNQVKYANAEGERAAAERLVAESERVIDETTKRTIRTQRDVNKKLDQRIDDIKFWQKEVDDKLDGVKKEIDALGAFQLRIEKAIESCKEPLHIAQQCLANRQRRKGIDLVHDNPEKELLKEVEVIQGVLALLYRTNEQVKEQLRLNRKAKYNLEKDLADKFSALSIDETNSELRNNSEGIHCRQGVAKVPANSVTVDDWESFSNENILAAERQRNNSINLRSLVDGILQQVARDMEQQRVRTDTALQIRVDETRDAKCKLEDHLAHVLKQITEMEDNIARLQRALCEKQQPMALAQTRLELRTERPNVELCRDTVQYRLIEEVTEITGSVEQLQQRLAQSEHSLKALIRRQLELEEEIEIKANTLFIDETECQGMRKSICIQAY